MRQVYAWWGSMAALGHRHRTSTSTPMVCAENVEILVGELDIDRLSEAVGWGARGYRATTRTETPGGDAAQGVCEVAFSPGPRQGGGRECT